VDVSAGPNGADPVAAWALGPAEVVGDPELAADDRRLFISEAEAAPFAGLADDGEISCRAEKDDCLLEQLGSPPDSQAAAARSANFA
jgi:hypothetical protein